VAIRKNNNANIFFIQALNTFRTKVTAFNWNIDRVISITYSLILVKNINDRFKKPLFSGSKIQTTMILGLLLMGKGL
jgi:hypothetical protein